jgi:HrpA-like RNA helicase
VAEERGAPLGREVGYVVRFDDCSSVETKIKFITDGILVREMMGDPLLKQYSVLILDEGWFLNFFQITIGQSID